MTPAAISGRIGAPLEQVRECIGRFCSPDPESRSQAEEGRRLVLIDTARSWGWRVVNFEIYRKKARDAADVAQGRAAERARKYRERHASSRPVTSPNATHTPDSDSNKEKRERGSRKCASRVPPDFVPDLSLASSSLPNVDAEAEAQKFRDWEFKTPRSDWAAAWRNWVRRCKETGQYAKKRINGEWL